MAVVNYIEGSSFITDNPNSNIYTLVDHEASGGAIIGGAFNGYGTFPPVYGRCLRILDDGSIDATWNSSPGGVGFDSNVRKIIPDPVTGGFMVIGDFTR